MKAKRLSVLPIIINIILILWLPLTFAADTTVKVGLSQAQESAMKWKTDAVLVQLSTLTGSVNGTADKWSYMFHSPKAKQGYRVDVKQGIVDRALEVSSSFIDPIDVGFVDSDAAVAEAKKKGLKMNGRTMMTLQVMLKGTKNQGAYWNIVGNLAEGKSMIIDAKTGKFLRYQVLE